MYSKGALLFHMLRLELGEKDFWQAIKHYSSQMWEKNTTTRDLQLSFEYVSGRDLKPFFDTWVYREQRLDVSVNFTLEKNNLLHIELEQLQQYPLAFPLQIQVAEKEKTQLLTLAVSEKQQHFSRQLAWQPTSIRFDPQHYLPLQIKSEALLEFLPKNLQQGKTVLDRYWDMKAMVSARNCQDLAELIEAKLSIFSEIEQPRILQSAAEWWTGQCIK